MHAMLPLLQTGDFPNIARRRLETVQVNLGYRCNQSCLHCHVNAGPKRHEIMDLDTIHCVLDFLDRSGAFALDLTGGAPEMNPHFRYLVSSARKKGVRVLDRCNLTILLEPDAAGLAEFLADQGAEIIASLPCYLEENVDRQRGSGVFETSIRALRRLNELGYGKAGSSLLLNLVFNPQGPTLPPPQAVLEEKYRQVLWDRYGIVFNHLHTLVNMPIQRFGSTLATRGQLADYMRLLRNSHRAQNVAAVMCRALISVGWDGMVYDCDFNQMLGLTIGGRRRHISEINTPLEGEAVATADHCWGCTAGSGSSCNGALST